MKLIDYLLPASKQDLPKFIPLVTMFLCFVLIHAIIKNIKDALIVTKLGAEMIPYIKFWVTLPSSIFFVFIYYKLLNNFSFQTIFLSIICCFLIFFNLFAFYIYPNLNQMIINIDLTTNHNVNNIINLVCYWPFTMFYVVAELWSSVGITLLFWQFANQISLLKEAKRYYAGIMLVGNIGPIIGGVIVVVCSSTAIGEQHDIWATILNRIMLVCTACCVIISISFILLGKFTKVTHQPEKTKLGIIDSLKLIFSSKTIACIFVMIFGYGITINILEVLWKSQVALIYYSPESYNLYMGKFSIVLGVVGILISLIGKNVIQFFPWHIGTIMTPILLAVTGVAYMLTYKVCSYFNLISITAIIFWGSIQNIIAKGAKHALFDPTKEMIYIVLDPELKTKGKAALDVAGYRLAKSSGGLVLQLVFMFGNITQMIFPLVAVILVSFALWMKSIFYISRNLNLQPKC